MRTPVTRSIFALLTCVGAASVAHADTTTVDSRVDRATVFPNAVTLHRAAHVRLAEGEHTVVFAPLPPTLDDDSIRIGGFGPGATADAVSVRLGTRGETLRGELTAAEARVEALRRQRDDAAPRGPTAVPPAARARLAGLDAGVDAAVRALEQLRALGAQPAKFVAVEITTERAGELTLGLEYTLPNGANWRPAYAAHLDDAHHRVGLDVFATLQQTTGEDWTDVQLSVSTIVPPTRLTIPQLDEAQLALDPGAPVFAVARAVPMPGAFASGAPRPASTAGAADRQEYAPPPAPTPVAMSIGSAHAQALAARIDIPAHVTLRSGAPPRRVQAAHLDVDAGLEYQAAPSQSPAVFLVSRFANHAAFPLLAGRVALFVGDQYVGATSVPDVPIDEPVLLPFGADAGLALERTLADHRASHTDARDATSQRYQYRLANHLDHAATVVVFDRLPTSQSRGLVIRTLPGSRAPDAHHDGDAPGVVRFTSRVEPGATSRWDFGYVVDAPRGRALLGALP